MWATHVSGITFIAIPPCTRVTEATSWKVRPSKVTGTDGAEASAAMPIAARWMALSACQGRAECPERPVNVHVALRLPAQPACSALSVGSITTTNSASSVSRASSGVSALSSEGSSSRGKNSAAYGTRCKTNSIITASAPCMSEAPRPKTSSPSIRPGRLSCAGTVSRCPASRTDGRVSDGYASTQSSPSSRTSAPPARSTEATCAASADSSRDSDAMSISSSVRAASRAASSRSLGAGVTGTRGTLEWKVLERSRNGRTTQSRYAPPPEAGRARQRAYVIGASPEVDDLDELKELLRTAGVATVGVLTQKRDSPHQNLYLGPGKVDELKALLKPADANVVVADDELTPRQQRNLEAALDIPVLDRTAVILDIFASHAHTAEGKMQVELAQLEYNMARMRGLWTHLERLGAGRGVGGIGTRGPGESQIETDRRLARDRITVLRRRLDHVKSTRATQRAERERAHLPNVALAGYTNAGKSTLLNALTGSEVGVRDRLFHTLDPTTRTLRLQGRAFLMTDTVGFIRKLPHQLVDAFAATLEETRLADLVLHVVDASAPEDELVAMTRAVEDVLEEIHAGATPRLLVLNKADVLDEERRRELAFRHPDAALVSAATGEGLEALGERIAAEFERTLCDIELLVPFSDGGTLSELHDVAGDLERTDTPQGVRVQARLPAVIAERFDRYAVNGDRSA